MGQGSKKPLWVMILTAFLVFSFSSLAPGRDKVVVKDRIATVNGSPISVEELNREVENIKMRLASSGQQLNRAQVMALRERVLENLINRELLFQESKKKGIKVSKKELEAKMKEVRGRFPSEDQFKAALKRTGMSEDLIRSQLERALAIEKYIEVTFGSKVNVTQKEAKEFYQEHAKQFMEPEQVRASHILIKIPSGADKAQREKALKKIKEIQEKAKKGEDFAELAKKYSDGPSAQRGGDLGFFPRGRMVKAFEDAAFSLETGKISEIVETQFGYHIIKVTEKKEAGKIPFEKIKDRLVEFLKDQEVRKQVVAHLNTLKKDANIERFLEK